MDAVLQDMDYMRTRSPHVFLGLSIPYAPDGEKIVAAETKEAEKAAETPGAAASPNNANASDPKASATPGQPDAQKPYPTQASAGQSAADRLVARNMIPVQQKNLNSIVSSDPVAVRGVEFFSYREFDARRDEIIQLMSHAAAAKSYIIMEVRTALLLS